MQPRHALSLLRQMGPNWVVYRAAYAVGHRGGWLRRRMPQREWHAYSLGELAGGRSPADLVEQLRQSPFRPSKSLTGQGGMANETAVIDEVEQALQGRVRLFSTAVRTVGWPPNWHRHPESDAEWPRVHWTEIDDSIESDVKWLWELGRFGIVYAIVRAHAQTGDDRYAEAFWTLVESWRAANPPNIGVHWMCGQECAYRALAWTFALLAFVDAKATTPARAAMLVEMIAAHGERIEANLGYARSQKNNHAINEALAVWTIGTILPMLSSSNRWERIGRAVLEEEAERQIYTDGAYVQHSLSYHRLILESYAWAIEFGRRFDRPFSAGLLARYRQATRFLYQLVDETSGRMPNYGSNDGSRLFKLDGCEPLDLRPTIALAFWVGERKRVLPAGPWDEPIRWMTGDQIPQTAPNPPLHVDLAASEGGYYTLRSGDTWGFLRCCTYRDRPAQADMLHLDLWWRGHNIVADPGTYSYSSPPPWTNGLSSTRVHNTVTVDGLDQMERGTRFVWFDWNRGRVLRRMINDQLAVKLIEAEHDGYIRRVGVKHRRTVLLAGGRLWIVVDDLIGSGVHAAGWQWMFPGGYIEGRSNGVYRIDHPAGILTARFAAFPVGDLDEPMRVDEIVSSERSTLGWVSDAYLHKRPVLSLALSIRARVPLRVVTTIALGESVTIDALDREALKGTIDGLPFVAELITESHRDA